MKVLYFIFAVSILLNLWLFIVDTIPFIWPILKRKIFSKNENREEKQILQISDYLQFENRLVQKANKMIKSDKIYTIWNEHRGYTETIFNFLRYKSHHNFRAYNYPRAFLYYGLSEYYKKTNDIEGQKNVKRYFDKLIKDNGEPRFSLDKVDQVPFGLVALNLHTLYDEDKYKIFYESIFKFLIKCRNEKGLILYRSGSNNILYDLLGMIIPFLVEYYKVTLDSNAIRIAKRQLDNYIEYGVDKETLLPAHGIDLKSNIKIGSINWGRGIGWYLLGLSALYSETGDYNQELCGIYNSLNKVRTSDNLFSQFPGSSKTVDASTSTMFLYSFSFLKEGEMSANEILDLLSPYIDKDGGLMCTSGDTYWLNVYSQSFGYSELSQGMLLLLLSRTY